MKYVATFPLLLNIADQPTYFMALKGQDGLVKMYAMVNVQQYQIVETGGTVAECETNYRRALAQSNLIQEEQAEIEQPATDIGPAEFDIRDIRTVEIDGDTNYFLGAGQDQRTGTKVYFQINAAEDPRVAFLQVGDGVMLAYDRGQEPVELLDRDKKPVVRIYKAELSAYYGGTAAPAEPTAPASQDQPVEDFSAETPVA